MTKIPAWVDGTLMPMDKLKVHQLGLRHKAISVFVMDGKRVLLQQRALGKYHTPGLWANTCCTHPHWQEDAKVCAVRRLQDELGISGLDPIFRDQIEYRADVGGGMIEHEVVDLFVANAEEQTLKFAMNPEEVADTRWVDIRELATEVAQTPAMFTPWLRIYMADHLDVVITP
ncbi:MAG: isopentenyl-diphosphate Delta-isomerase [Octadecabacter sp.]